MPLSRRKEVGYSEKGEKLVLEQSRDVRALVTEKRPEQVGTETSGRVYMGGGADIFKLPSIASSNHSNITTWFIHGCDRGKGFFQVNIKSFYECGRINWEIIQFFKKHVEVT